MDKLISLVSFTSRDAQTGGGDSFVDRLNCRYTVFILSVFAIMVTTKHYAGEPINCWCPSHFTDSHVDFTNAVSMMMMMMMMIAFTKFHVLK